ncbi:hypothetical protein [Robertmurraya siralis]|uniref:hypothetical protein n=1 Tax=Robertmurraya siralis TaxID=77777 RepID=UPI0010F9DEE7|nr:hypothetical protein [Robertmurraya siralis]
MKVDYKGFEINVEREKALGGWDSTYYTVMEKKNGFFLVDSFSDSNDTVREWIKDLKKRVDEYLENLEEWED